MDQDSIERIRSASFPLARKGYEQSEVDRFLSRLADWLASGAADDSPSDHVRRELERIGEQTAKILTDAHDAAEGIRSEATRYAAGMRSEADAYSERVRIDADTYGRETTDEADAYMARHRNDADAYAEEARANADREAAAARRDAEAKAQAMIEDGNRRRAEIEKVISDLEKRRDAVLEDMQRLSSELTGTATSHRTQETEAVAADEDGAEPQPAPDSASR